jgi:O-antigen ligase
MSLTQRASRLAFATFLSCTVLALAGAFGLRSAEQHDARGTVDGFPQPIYGADTLTLGVNVELDQYADDALDARLALLASNKIRAVRQAFRWSDIEPQQGRFDWTASDRVINAARKHGIKLFVVLHNTPGWARGLSGSAEAPAIATAPPADPADFARFAGAFARRYDDGQTVLAYQIWDEPNLSSAWGNALINPALYLQMLQAARSAIHAEQPSAIIALAALAPTVEQSNVNLAPQTFLLRLYQLGGHQAFDIVTAKPYGFAFSPDDRRVDAGLLNFSHVILLRDVMVAHDDGHKAIWAGQFGWNALPPGWQGESSIWGAVSEAEQRAYSERAVHRAAREWPWLGAMFIETLEPAPRAKNPTQDARWGFALLDQRGQPRSVFDAFVSAAQDANRAPRASLFAACTSPQSLARTLRLENLVTALPEVTASTPDCGAPNPRAEFSPGWRFDQLGADIPERPDANVRVRFSGDALALIIRRGNYRAYTYVSIDGQAANLLPRDERGAYLIMTSPGLYPVIETIPVASGLGPGEHVAEITVERGWNQWALIGWSARTTPESRIPWQALLVCSAAAAFGALISARGAQLRELFKQALGAVPGLRSFDPRTAATALLLWATAALAWSQDAATAWRNLGLPINLGISGATSALLFWSPAMVISLLALVALFVLIVMRIETGLVLAAFFVPFFLLPQRLFARAFPMVEILTLMCITACAIRLLPRLRRIGTPQLYVLLRKMRMLDWAMLALALVGILATLQARQQIEAWRELRLVIIEPALLYLALRIARPTHETQRLIALAFVSGAVLMAGYGLFNYARGERFFAEGGLPRIKSVYDSPNNDALYLERVLPFALIFALTQFTQMRAAVHKLRSHWLHVAGALSAVVMIGLALLLTQSRGALLFGVPSALIVMLVLAGRRARWLGISAALLAAFGIAALMSGMLTPLLAGTRLANAFDLTRGTGFFRLNLWQSAWRMWLDAPLFGVGPDNFLYAYRSFYILPAAWQEPNLSHPHNVLFDWATRLGTAGILVLGALLIGIGRRLHDALRHTDMRPLALACAGSLAATLGHGLVDHSFFLVDLMYAFVIVAGLAAQGNTD